MRVVGPNAEAREETVTAEIVLRGDFEARDRTTISVAWAGIKELIHDRVAQRVETVPWNHYRLIADEP